jgi:6-phosphofructokinase 1
MIVCEVMGHNTGWLALGGGMAGGADVILIPEIPYDLDVVAEHLLERRRSGKRFSIVTVAEGAVSKEEAEARAARGKEKRKKKSAKGKREKRRKKREKEKAADGPSIDEGSSLIREVREPMASRLARQLQQRTGSEARLTSLGHVQRGGAPTPTDRILCTRLGTKAAELLAKGVYNVMVAVRSDDCVPVPLEEVAGRRKTVPLDHPWLTAARLVGTCLGD